MASTQIRLAILGPGAVGKSALTIQFCQNQFVKVYDPTIENSYRKQITVEDKIYVLDLLDTAGQEEYSAMRHQYISTGQGFLLVYSVASRVSFNSIPDFREQVTTVKGHGYPMVLIGNKCDLPEGDREVSMQEGENLAKKWSIPFLEASAKTAVNVEEAFRTLLRQITDFTNHGGVIEEDEDHTLPKSQRKKNNPTRRKCVIL